MASSQGLVHPDPEKVDSRFTPQIVEAVVAILQDPELGALTKFNECVKVLRQNMIVYTLTCLCCLFLVHPKNRGGLGINPHNSHKTMKTIKTTGGDRRQLKKAVAFEIQTVGKLREAQLAFNRKLIDESDGLMAPMNGKERFLTVSCSHFTQGCRSVDAGCRTPFNEIADDNGRINKLQYCGKDTEMRSLIDDGWEWLIFPASTELVFPGMAQLAQSALNADHKTYSLATELETMMALASLADGSDFKTAIEKVLTSEPPCAAYIESVAAYAKLYGGGPGSPILRYAFTRVR